MFDNRYPELTHLDHAPSDARRWGRRVASRTMVKAAYDRDQKVVVFWHGSNPLLAAHSEKWDTRRSEDEICRSIYLGRMPQEEQHRIMAEVRAARKTRDEREKQRRMESGREAARDALNWRSESRGMGSKYRPTVDLGSA